jgi:hypothetical protein
MSSSEIRGSWTRKPTPEPTKPESSAHCCVDIRIENQGPINIYTCTSAPPGPAPCPEPCPPECPAGPIAPGQCIPLSIGSKPKQSLRTKLDSLLQNTRVPSAIASGFFQHARRFSAGQTPANLLETEVFGFFETLPADMKSILSCSVNSFDGITSDERNRLLDPSIPQNPNVGRRAGLWRPTCAGAGKTGPESLLRHVRWRELRHSAADLQGKRPSHKRIFACPQSWRLPAIRTRAALCSHRGERCAAARL